MRELRYRFNADSALSLRGRHVIDDDRLGQEVTVWARFMSCVSRDC